MAEVHGRRSEERPSGSPPGSSKRKSAHVWSDFERQLFNIDLSASEFRRLAKSEEERSMVCKRRCSALLGTRQEEDAWQAAEAAIKAQNDAFLFNTASERLRQFHKMVTQLEEPDASMLRIVMLVDQSVRGYDPKGTMEVLDELDLERRDAEREEMVRVAASEPLEEEVRAFLNRAEARKVMAWQLRGLNPPRPARSPRADVRKPGRQLDSSQTPIETPKVKRKGKSGGLTYGMKGVRFSL